MAVLVGTADGLYRIGSQDPVALAGHRVTSLAQENGTRWAIVDGESVWGCEEGGAWSQVAALEGRTAHCLLPTRAGVFVGTSEAHLHHLEDGELKQVGAFDEVEGRDTWHTPWGGLPDTRSMFETPDGEIYVNVHVGGVVHSLDGGVSWQPTGLDIRNDVHQVLFEPSGSGKVLVAAARGYGTSTDGGDSWKFSNDGLHASYLRALATSDLVALVTASRGPRGGEAAVYRRPLDESEPFEKCQQGLPEWFSDNIDTYCIDASGALVVFGARDGAVFISEDHGASWNAETRSLPRVECVLIEH